MTKVNSLGIATTGVQYFDGISTYTGLTGNNSQLLVGGSPPAFGSSLAGDFSFVGTASSDRTVTITTQSAGENAVLRLIAPASNQNSFVRWTILPSQEWSAGIQYFSSLSGFFSICKGDIVNDVNNYFNISTTGKVGINTTGTVTPQSTLDISGNVSVGTYAGVSAAPSNGMIISGAVGIGTASLLSGSILNTSTASTGTTVSFTSTGTYAAGGGNFVASRANTGAAPVSSGSRLGGFVLGGSIDSMGTPFNSAAMIAFATETWNPGAGTYLRFETTPNGSGTRAERIRIGQDGKVYIGAGTTAINLLDVPAGVAIGSYAGVNTAPTNGLLVSGKAAFGASSVGTADYLFSSGAATTTFRILCTDTSSPILSLTNASAEWQLFSNSAGDFFIKEAANLVSIDTVGIVSVLLNDLKISTAGKTLFIKEGSNAKMGTATMNGGATSTVTVNTTAVTANSRIFITGQTLGTIVLGAGYSVSARVAATSFTITSSTTLDTSTVAWVIFEPA